MTQTGAIGALNCPDRLIVEGKMSVPDPSSHNVILLVELRDCVIVKSHNPDASSIAYKCPYFDTIEFGGPSSRTGWRKCACNAKAQHINRTIQIDDKDPKGLQYAVKELFEKCPLQKVVENEDSSSN